MDAERGEDLEQGETTEFAARLVVFRREPWTFYLPRAIIGFLLL